MNKPCILTIDGGTTSIKVSLFSEELTLIACAVREYALTTTHDQVEAEAEQYIKAICDGVNEVQLHLPLESEIEAIGITTQGETLVLLDANGAVLTSFIVWLDGRAQKQAQALATKLDAQYFYEQTGLPEITGSLPLAKVMWLRENRSAQYEQAAKIMLLEDYLLYWLTGNYATEKSIQTSTGWFNLHADGYWGEALMLAGIDESKLPPLFECGTKIGSITQSAAALLNLHADVSVVAGAMDQTAAALATGCIKSGFVTETTGTALVMAACTEAPIFLTEHRVTIYRHALKGKFLYLPIGNTAGMALKWFRDEFCAELDVSDYAIMDVLASGVEAGAGGVIFLPFLSGCVDPDNNPQAKAVFFGATLATTRAHFVRSVLESIGYMLHDFIDMLETLGARPTEVLSMGGGSRSALWQQIKADICGIPFCAANCSEAASQGAALLALWGAGLVPYGKVLQHNCAVSYAPNEQNQAIYHKAYQTYQNLYAAVKPLF